MSNEPLYKTDGAEALGQALSDTPQTGRRADRKMSEVIASMGSVGIVVVSLAVGLGLWEVIARWIANPLILVPMTAVVGRLAQLIVSGEIWPHFSASAQAFVYGYGLAVVLGVLLGLVLAEARTLRAFLDPWLDALYATPMVVFAPIFVVSMGIGISSKIAVVFLVSFFPIVITTLAGALLVEPKLLDMGRSFGYSRFAVTRKIRAPFALPSIIAGLRVASARGLIGVVVGEMFGARAGLGYLIVTSSQNFDTVGMFAGGVVLIIFGVLINSFLRWLGHRLAPWKGAD
jgi:NitT/TauT family transport system permease protein